MNISDKSFETAFNLMWNEILEPMIRDKVLEAINEKKDELKNHILFHFRQQEKLRAAKKVEEVIGILVEGSE